MTYLPSPSARNQIRWLLLLCALIGTPYARAEKDQIVLAYPGDELYQEARPKKTKLSTWLVDQRWSALSVNDGALIVEPVTTTIESDWVSVSGKEADRLLEGKTLKRPAKPKGISLKPPTGALVLVRIEPDNGGGSRGLTPGRYPSYVTPTVLREGWAVTTEVDGQKWKFYTRHEKRPDGKLLAGSLEILADHEMPNGKSTVMVPQAGGAAFLKQELLWLGDLNDDGEPDLLLRRTLLTGEIEFVLVVTPSVGYVSHDPDQPASYFSSGVEPESNGFTWNRKWPIPTAIKFVSQGRFSIGEEEWRKKLDPGASSPNEETRPQEKKPQTNWELLSRDESSMAIPILLTDRLFKLNGETIRFTLEHLPRVGGGRVLVKTFFRGKSQILMEAEAPDGGPFVLSVGLIDGGPGIRVDHQPHYNNSFSQYWVYEKAESRFRRHRIVHSQGC